MTSRVLYVDLSEKEVRSEERGELFAKYIGGAGVASKLLLEKMKPKADAFDPENVIIFAIGPLTTLYPLMAKCISMFKSPLTGDLGESHAGGHFGSALRFAGYGALVINGASERPVILKIRGNDVSIQNASSLWGLTAWDVERALREEETFGLHGVASCGIAGENMVAYANVLVDRFHHFGRLGLGAVFGAKKLKAISIVGEGDASFQDCLAAKALYEKFHYDTTMTDKMIKYHEEGTPFNVLPLNEIGALPTRNFMEARFENAEKISGEAFLDRVFKKKISCPGCPTGCVHLASLKKCFAPEHEKGRVEVHKEEQIIPYSFEPIYAMGSNLGVSDPEGVVKLLRQCEYYGIDTLMAGTVLGWATEAFDKRLITIEDTDGLRPRWDDADIYAEMIRNIALAKNPFYAKLAQGVVAAAGRYGGKDFAINAAGNGLAGYATGYCAILGALVAARHSHISNSGYSIDQKTINNPASPEVYAKFLVDQEDWLYAFYSLVACYFSRQLYTNKEIVDMLKTIGIEKTEEDIMALGRQIFHNLYKFKIQEGFDLEKMAEEVPETLFKLKTPHGVLDKEKFKKILTAYVKLREAEGLQLRKEDKVLEELLGFKEEGE